MRKLFVLGGAASSGKTALAQKIEQTHPGAGALVLSHFDFAALLSGPHRASDGHDYRKNPSHDKAQIDQFFESAVRSRMSRGETVFLDIPCPGEREFRKWRSVARQYAYTFAVVDVQGDQPVADLERRHDDAVARGERIPAKVADEFAAWCALRAKIPALTRGECAPITAEQMFASLIEPVRVLPDDARVVVIGDVQSCARSLAAILDATDARNADLVIFAGDLYDRGPDPASVYRQVTELESQVPVIRVRGNHDKWQTTLRYKTEHPNARHAAQPVETIRACLDEGILTQDLADQDASTVSYAALRVAGTEYRVTHGGAAYIGEKVPDGYASGVVAEQAMIFGENTPESTVAGRHSRRFDIDAHLNADHRATGVVHIRGHFRIDGRAPDHTEGVYVLESEVEFGDAMTALVIDGPARSVVQVPGEPQVKGWGN